MKKMMTAEDLTKIVSVSHPVYSPDGTKAVFTKVTVNEKKDDYNIHLWVRDEETEELSQWTFEDGKHHQPVWSKDGRQLAFILQKPKEIPQLALIQSQGGSIRTLTAIPYGVSHPVFSPDGAFIYAAVSMKPSEAVHDEKKEERDDFAPAVYDDLTYKADGRGFLDGRFTQIIQVDTDSGEVEVITSGQHHHVNHTVSPCGKWLAYIQSNPQTPYISDVCLLSLEDGTIKKMTQSTGAYSTVSFSPNGESLLSIGHEREFQNATFPSLWLYDLKEEKVVQLSEMLDMYVGNCMAGDSIMGEASQLPQWTKDSQGFYTLVSDQGSTGIYYVSIEGLAYPVRLEEEHITNFSLHPDEAKMLLSRLSHVSPSELYELTLGEQDLKQITFEHDSFLKEHILSVPEPFSFRSKEGDEVHGWFMKPSQMEAGKTYPLILEIHGGPHAMYGHTYFHEFQMLAAEGYAVVYINPHGSHGYGQMFTNRVRGSYGDVDYEDVMQAVDHVLKAYDFLDETRLGVTGGSYGGFMTNWIVGQTGRFRAAVTQRSISNWISFYGISDIGYFFTRWQIDGDIYDSVDKLWDRSPLKYVKQVSTPLLILHSDEDYRCPVDQAEQLFVALKELGKDTRLVKFPKASHDLSRSGHPGQRIQRLNFMKEWFREKLS
ncbi:alpha/beta hydrolase family protein [Bacillus pumilus]|uniref:Peptidase n=1 Tax=Bacillus pumilus TaxID=1408 RepID=A0AAD0MMP8_BACPU|nr:S9 family peptidase [Bacillus pumilus]AVM25288.1 peptidase [Bacillus pumilus]TYS40978.1 S9 family peptidase [Bacillus pumilus]